MYTSRYLPHVRMHPEGAPPEHTIRKRARGPQDRRRGRGARERILGARQQLVRERASNAGVEPAVRVRANMQAHAYQRFAGQDKTTLATQHSAHSRRDCPVTSHPAAVQHFAVSVTAPGRWAAG